MIIDLWAACRMYAAVIIYSRNINTIWFFL